MSELETLRKNLDDARTALRKAACAGEYATAALLYTEKRQLMVAIDRALGLPEIPTLDQWMKAHLPLLNGDFKANAFYNEHGDEIECWWEGESSFTAEVQGRQPNNRGGFFSAFGIHRAQSDKRITGCDVYSVRGILAEAGYAIVPLAEAARLQPEPDRAGAMSGVRAEAKRLEGR